MRCGSRIAVTSIDISPGRMSVRLQLASSERNSFYTDDRIAQKALRIFPDLAQHSCKNNFGPYFGEVMNKTSLPHLLEHMVISAQISDPSTKAGATFVGNTKWIDEKSGIAEISVSFVDDVVALESLNASIDALNSILA